MRTDRIAGVLLMLAVTVIWSIINIIIKHVLVRDFHPLLMTCGLYVPAIAIVLPLAVVLASRGNGGRRLSWRLPRVLPLVGLAKAAEAVAFVYAIRFISATQASLLSKSECVWIFLILLVCFRNEVGWSSLAGTILSLVGVYFLMGGPGLADGVDVEVLVGSGLAIFAGLAFAVMAVLLQKAPSSARYQTPAEHLQFTGLFMAAGLAFIVPFAAAYVPSKLPRTEDLLWVGFAGVMNGLAFYLYYAALRRISSMLAMVLMSFTVFFTLSLERLFFGSPDLTAAFVTGGVLIIAGAITVGRQSSPQ